MDRAQIINPNRLKSARLYRNLTISELAEKTNVTKQAISQYENGRSKPKLETLMLIKNVLHFPIDFFYVHDQEQIVVGNTFFRSLYSTGKKERSCVEEKLKSLAEIYVFLKEYIDFPKLDISNLSECTPSEAARRLRREWNLGSDPIQNVVRLLERHGIIVTSFDLGTTNIDALCQSQMIDGSTTYFMAVTNNKGFAARRNFNIAHELGHIVLHDPTIDVEELSKDEFRQMEKDANEFAADFLLPEDSFLDDLHYPKDLAFYVQLKKKWKVSVAAMVVRAYNLGVLNHNQYQYLMRKMNAAPGWKGRNEEPLDRLLAVYQPVALKNAIDLLLVNDVFSAAELLDKLSLCSEDVEELLNLENDTLKVEIKEQAPQVRLITNIKRA